MRTTPSFHRCRLRSGVAARGGQRLLWAARSAGGFAKACTRIALHVVCCAIELGVALILCLAGRRWLVLHALLGIASIESEMANAKDVGLLTDVFCCLRRGPPFCVHGILGAWCEARLAFPQGGRKRDPASDSSFRGICLWVRRFSHLPSVVVVCVCVWCSALWPKSWHPSRSVVARNRFCGFTEFARPCC